MTVHRDDSSCEYCCRREIDVRARIGWSSNWRKRFSSPYSAERTSGFYSFHLTYIYIRKHFRTIRASQVSEIFSLFFLSPSHTYTHHCTPKINVNLSLTPLQYNLWWNLQLNNKEKCLKGYFLLWKCIMDFLSFFKPAGKTTWLCGNTSCSCKEHTKSCFYISLSFIFYLLFSF